ncbi:MAG: transporter [Sphingomonas bacterium]
MRLARLLLGGLAIALPAAPALAQEPPAGAIVAPAPARQALDDAWWTGPMLANSAATLPRGHALVETYVFDRISGGAQSYGSLTYLLYGLTDTLTLGARPMVGFNPRGGARGVGMADLTLQAQYRLSSFSADPWKPAIAVSVLHSLPTGRYDRLGARPGDGLGSGAHTTTLALYAQNYTWLRNGRLLRTRLNISTSLPGKARVEDVSVYGTGEGFRGEARPGVSFDLGGSVEYSVTRSWVLALDLVYDHTAPTRVAGVDAGGVPVARRYGTSDSFAIAPGIEYSWMPNLGVLLAARFVPRSYNTAPSITPAVAINFVY